MQSQSKINCPVCKYCDTKSLRAYRSNMSAFSGLSLRTCSKCRVSFADPLPSSEDLKAYYKNTYRSEGSPWQIQHEPSPWGGALTRVRSQIDFIARKK